MQPYRSEISLTFTNRSMSARLSCPALNRRVQQGFAITAENPRHRGNLVGFREACSLFPADNRSLRNAAGFRYLRLGHFLHDPQFLNQVYWNQLLSYWESNNIISVLLI